MAQPHIYTCSNCRRVAAVKFSPVSCVCGLVVEVDVESLPLRPEAPTLATRARHYGAAVTRWIGAGRPVRSDEAAEANVAVCRQCPGGHFDGQVCTHARCGCNIAVGETGLGLALVALGVSAALVSKAKMATETCPGGYWEDSLK